ncbi:MAG: NAD-dependent DNA ligase LigA, partial [Clostridia bacterium]|nr:NAD-dependent DNA ligase LigA [Clostridia bacterium]
SFIYALGIPNVGKKTAKDLTKHYKILQYLQNANIDELSQIRDIGSIVAQSIVDYFNDEYNKNLINELFEFGVDIQYSNVQINQKFNGLTFVLTGTLETMTRNEATLLIEQNGGQTSSSVSKNTNYVLAGAEAGSKLAKAKQLGITVIDEEYFKKMLKS